ncbi:MAG: ACT domain-containing protein [Candidatus Rokubacteria bacterium]|nr:ACT domain-containing protein [Candidatus Rokubacteria bacterium]
MATTEFTVTLPDRPGALARLGGVLGDGGVNIEAIQGMSRDGQSVVRFVPRDEAKARDVLAAAGIAYQTREILVVKVLDEPGTLGDVALVMSRAGINIDAVYVTTRGHIVLGVDDLPGAIQVAGGMAVMAFD